MSAMLIPSLFVPRAAAIFLSTSLTRALSFLTGPVSPVSMATTLAVPMSATSSTPLGAKLIRPTRLIPVSPS